VSVIDALVNSQVSSLASAAIVISIVLFVVFRSVSIALLSMIPNLFPVILNFGIMGLLGIPLDTGTALITAIALGISVDDTVHFMIE
jgi:predicted RND superfamily exporter protein